MPRLDWDKPKRWGTPPAEQGGVFDDQYVLDTMRRREMLVVLGVDGAADADHRAISDLFAALTEDEVFTAQKVIEGRRPKPTVARSGESATVLATKASEMEAAHRSPWLKTLVNSKQRSKLLRVVRDAPPEQREAKGQEARIRFREISEKAIMRTEQDYGMPRERRTARLIWLAAQDAKWNQTLEDSVRSSRAPD